MFCVQSFKLLVDYFLFSCLFTNNGLEFIMSDILVCANIDI